MGSSRTRVPKQGRSKQTRESLARAALDLFERKGYHNTTSRDIAELAGTSVGSFYVYFEDKRDILLELVDSLKQDSLDRTRHLLLETNDTSAAPRERVSGLLSSLSMVKDVHPYLWAQAKLLAHFDGDVAERLSSFAEELSAEIAAVISDWAPRVEVDDAGVAAAVVLQMAGVIDFVNGGDNEAVAAEVKESLCRYLYPTNAM
jgi:AcrR family transcriptional regulator